MPKVKKAKPSQTIPKVPLAEQMDDDKFAKPKNRVKTRIRKDDDEKYIDAKLSKKILTSAREQQKELESEFPTLNEAENHLKMASLSAVEYDSESEPEDALEPDMYYESIEFDEDDERAVADFMSKNPKPRRVLADIIMEKLTEKNTEALTEFSDAGSVIMQDIDPRVQKMYQTVGSVLKQYRSGKLPKAFKVIPKLTNWEQILHCTDPQNWSAATMYQATRIFASNLKEHMVQKFYNLVLLPRIRDDLAEYKRLNFHLYQALRKALFKPGGFMKGLLLPLLESGNCTLREAIIVGSILARNSVPLLHSCAAMLKICEMEYTGANSIILRIFFDKKYALPYRVVDGVVDHYIRFEMDSRELPVLWHQALLTFVQRYKSEITMEQRDYLLDLIRKHSHPEITPEIRRELVNAKTRELMIKESEAQMQTE